MKISKPEYLQKALLLSVEERERVLSRMTGKLPRRLEKEKLSVDEALAIQLEIEDEQLSEWREKMHSMKKSDKKEAKPKTEEKTESPAKLVTPSQAKIKAAVKAKVPAAPKVVATKPAAAKPATPAKAKKI
jgi:hypothetical protein